MEVLFTLWASSLARFSETTIFIRFTVVLTHTEGLPITVFFLMKGVRDFPSLVMWSMMSLGNQFDLIQVIVSIIHGWKIISVPVNLTIQIADVSFSKLVSNPTFYEKNRSERFDGFFELYFPSKFQFHPEYCTKSSLVLTGTCPRQSKLNLQNVG